MAPSCLAYHSGPHTNGSFYHCQLFRIALTFWTARHSPQFCGSSGVMNSNLKAYWTPVMKDTESELPTAVCVSAVNNLQLSGNRPVARSQAASCGSGFQWLSWLKTGFGYAHKTERMLWLYIGSHYGLWQKWGEFLQFLQLTKAGATVTLMRVNCFR